MRLVHRLFLIALVFAVAAPLFAQRPTETEPGSPTPGAPNKPRPNTYGTGVTSYIEVPANSFLPWNSSETYTSDNFGNGPRWVTSGCCLVAPLHLPAGATIVYLEFDYFDNTAASVLYGSLSVCDYLGQNCSYHPSAGDGPADCSVPGFICSGIANASGLGLWGDSLIANDNITINNFLNSYLLLTQLNTNDGSTKIAGMIVGYKLQVSPAPVTATFTDVPTTHPQFQFVEALVAAGVTSGCNVSPPQYCPDQPLTRGQMAVFFSRALGLQWQ